MQITFLGTNGWYDTATGSTVCILVQAKDYDVIFDAGSGFSKVPDYITGDKPVYLFLSHLHLDHLYGLHTLVKQKFPQGLFIVVLEENRPQLDVYLHKPFTMPLADLPFAVTVIEAPRELAQVPFPVEVLPVIHADPTMGVRITLEGKVVVFSGDTGACDNLDTLAKNADVLITECAFKPGETNIAWPHLNPEIAALVALEGSARALYLTHFDASRYLTFADRDAAQTSARIIFPNTTASRDGMVIDVK